MDNTPTTRAFRSLVISLAVVLTIIDLTLGFTLRNPRYPDLFADESTKLEIQHEVKRSNDFETTKNPENGAVLPLRADENSTIAVNASVIITYPKDTTESFINNSSTEATEPLPVTDSSIVLNVNPSNPVEVTTSSTETKTTKSENQTETRAVNSAIRNIFDDNKAVYSTRGNMKNNDNFETIENAENRAVLPLGAEENRTNDVNASVNITYPKDATESNINNSSTEAMETLPVTNHSSIVLNVNPSKPFEVTTSSTETKTTKSENQTETRAVNSAIRNILDNDSKTVEKSEPFENFTTSLDPLKAMNATSPLLVTEGTTTVSVTTEHYTSISAFTANGEPESSKQTETEPPQIGLVSAKLNTTKPVTVNSITTKNHTTPLPWKKYSNITRRRTNNVTEFRTTSALRVADSMNSHSTESRVTLEKAFNLAPDIPSLQQLKNNLEESTKMAKGTGIETTITTESPTKPMVSSKNGQSINENATSPFTAMPRNQIEMVSKRAGYLNHTMPMAETQNTSVTESESDTSASEIDHQDNDRVEKKTSRSQLADDAIKEELLKESISMDEAVNTMMHNTLINPKQLQSFDVLTQTNVPLLTDWERKVEDELSVKPITQEKKNTILYTVNPNYKPLKKLEIQPPKPFTRDPDDNSWRNESLTSLGIVFNAKNSSKAFTEVLKNKTETVMNTLPDQNRTIEKIELRERLEKIAEKRKSKKKKTDSFGNVEYTDYEENNSSNDSRSSKEALVDIIPISPKVLETTTKIASTTSLVRNPFANQFATTLRAKSPFLAPEYYESAEDEDYPIIPKLDIKKTKTTTTSTTTTPATFPTTTTRTPRVRPMPVMPVMLDVAVPQESFPDRKPTVQYFPPRPRPSSVYNDKIENKINIYSINAPPQPPRINVATQNTERPTEESYPTKDDFRNDNINTDLKGTSNWPPMVEEIQYRPVENVYLTQPPNLVSENPHPYENPDNVKGGFIIRHYKDFIEKAANDRDYDRTAYLYTESPFTGVTANDQKPTVKSGEYPDYEQRKELLDRFVNNFNQNHERFKEDFPVLFNTSIVHKQGLDNGKVLASSSATFKRLYNDATASKANGFLFSDKAYDPNCENITVELSPAYELHYYVPDQEEREVQRKVTMPPFLIAA